MQIKALLTIDNIDETLLNQVLPFDKYNHLAFVFKNMDKTGCYSIYRLNVDLDDKEDVVVHTTFYNDLDIITEYHVKNKQLLIYCTQATLPEPNGVHDWMACFYDKVFMDEHELILKEQYIDDSMSDLFVYTAGLRLGSFLSIETLVAKKDDTIQKATKKFYEKYAERIENVTTTNGIVIDLLSKMKLEI